ncbi:MAG TPA: hypothetical protein VJG32_09665 [Anaerolineae bacterium]|nr:hypothetical protein [Anaerolineae bacterium]
METASESQDRFKSLVALLLAFVTVMGAVAAWRAAVASDAASNADFSGLAATLNTEETRALNSVTVYEHYRAYTDYLRHNELGNVIADDLPDASDSQAELLDRQMTEAWDLATEIQGSFFPNRYLDPDGNYDTQRELEEEYADAGQQKDLNPEPHFTLSDRLRNKSTTLVSVLIVLAVSLLLYTLAETIDHIVRYALAAGGTLFLVGSLVLLIIIETAPV